MIEFVQAPDSIENFAKILDDTLKEVNSDYEAKRQKNIALQPLEVIVARKAYSMTGWHKKESWVDNTKFRVSAIQGNISRKCWN